jgi:hypothetical protein
MEGIKLQTLKKQTMQIIENVTQDWVNCLKKAEKENEGIDLSEMQGKLMTQLKELDIKFLEANERLKKNRKGFLGL